jgi:hypothetical protein
MTRLEQAIRRVSELREFYKQIKRRRGGRPVAPAAAAIDARLFGRIRRMQQRSDSLAARLAESYAAVPTEDGMAEIDRPAAAVRSESRKARGLRKKTTSVS